MNYDAYRKRQKSFFHPLGEIKYIDSGRGKPVLLVHGIPSSSWSYRKLIEYLNKNNCRPIAPDMLGFGSSENPEGYVIYSKKSQGIILKDLVKYLKLKEVNLVVHDAGAAWTWEMLKLKEVSPKSITILNGLLLDKGFYPPVKMKKGSITKFFTNLYGKRWSSGLIMRQYLKNALKKDILTKQEKKGYITPWLEGKTNALYNFFSQTNNPLPDYREVFLSIKDIPKTVIWGKYDQMLRWAPMEEEAKHLLGIEEQSIHIIDAKHLIQEEEPEKIGSMIVELISK
jgi:pimeloyl-ACP methyl ester carboxylesterase